MNTSENKMPQSPSIRKMLGPSFILLGLGLGSGELILWPYLSANYGLGIIWGAIIGITLQFFINMEIERYTLATGESVFFGLFRKMGVVSPIWFILSTLIPWMWPGIIISSAILFTNIFDLPIASKYVGIMMLLAIGLILSTGKTVYKTQENVQKIIILFGVPLIFVIALIFAKPVDWQALIRGTVGLGEGYFLLPAGISIATFLGALAYAGAGGNLNLSQSLYIREKGYGMGFYASKLAGLFAGKKEDVSLEGGLFENSDENIKSFSVWWKKINIEHALVFYLTGAITMIMLSLLAYATVHGKSMEIKSGVSFIISESKTISGSIPFLGKLFLATATVMLFGTQLSVFGSTSRIMSENLCISSKKYFPTRNLSVYFYLFLWLQIFIGIGILLLNFTEPLKLVTTSAVLNAATMFVYSGLILWLNKTALYKTIQPNILRVLIVIFAFLFYGGFGLYNIIQSL